MIRRLIAVVLVATVAFGAGTEQAAAAIENASEGAPVSASAAAPIPALTSLAIPSAGLGAPGVPAGLDAGLALPTLPSQAASPAAQAARPGAALALPGASPAVPGAQTAASAAPAASAELSAPAPSFAQASPAQDSPAAQAGAAIDAAAARMAAAPASRVASQGRIARTIRSLKALFGSKQDALEAPAAQAMASAEGPAVPEAHLAASPANAPPAPSGAVVPPAPPSKGGGDGSDDDGGKGGKAWFGLGKTAVSFIGALVVGQIGVEALGAAMPTLVQKAFGDFTVVAQLAIFSSITGITGRQMAAIFIQKYGLKKVYLAAEAARVLSISALVGLLVTAHMTLPLMMGFYCLNGFLAGISVTAESSIPPAIVGQNEAKLQSFWTWEQTLLETIGVSGPIVTGMVVRSMGFVPALVAYPVALAAAIAILILTLRIPKKVEALRLADLQKAKEAGLEKTLGSVFKEFGQKVVRGAKLVWHDAALRTSFLAYTAYMALNPFLYSMLAPAYALRLTGNNPEVATGIGGWLTGLYSAGGLLAGLILLYEQSRLNKAKKAGMSDEQEAERLRVSMLKWMKLGTAGLLAMWTLTFASPIMFAGLTLPALALIPFGIAQVVTTVKLKSYFQAKAPQQKMADAMGFFGSASLAVSTAGLLALKYVFKAMPGFTPFWWIAAAMIPLGAYYVYLTRRMSRISKPDAAK